MKKIYVLVTVLFFSAQAQTLHAQCSTTNATSCVCEQNGQTDCDLLPDMTISWDALQNYAAGPSEYSQSGNGANDGRLRVTGSTPNIGHGPLNIRGVDQNGYRWFICGTDTVSIHDPSAAIDYTCTNGLPASQLIVQRIYHKDGNTMTYQDQFAGTMTYHPTHGHYHVDDWVTFTLRIEDVNEPNPLNWAIVGDGAKVGFCLMDYYSCTQGSADGHCRTSQEYGGGTVLNSPGDFDNFQLGGGGYSCGIINQGISVGYTDVYSESLDGMWIDVPPGTCNGDYWIIVEVDPLNNFQEEDENNNWTSIPFTLAQQVPGGGDFATISTNGSTEICSGTSIDLTATAGQSYLWSNGETTQSINVSTAGNYTVTVSGQCGVDASDPVSVTVVDPFQPVGTGATLVAPGSTTISATGSDVNWYDIITAGNLLHSGNNYATPVLSTTTSYWAEEQIAGIAVNSNGGKPDNSGGGGYYNNDQSLMFDAYEDFILLSVKVYAGSAGNRHFLCTDDGGNLIAETYEDLVVGEQVVTLNFNVPAGINHRMTIWDPSNSRDMYRNNSGVSYPYALGVVGEITTSTAGADWYYFCYDWEVQSIPLVCTSARTEVTVTVSETVKLEAKVFLEGPYDDASGIMNDDLRTASYLPNSEPFTALGFTHVNGGSEVAGIGVFDVTGNDAIVDWVMLELRDMSDNSIVLDTRSALIQIDGDIVDMDGVSPVGFSQPSGDYFISVRHRNHLGFMTNVTYSLTSAPLVLDLTNGSVATWGVDALKDVNGTMCMWMGNSFADAQIIYTGSNNDRDLILVNIGGTSPTDINTGYFNEDCNLDGIVKYTGADNDRDPILVNIGGASPTNSKQEQLP